MGWSPDRLTDSTEGLLFGPGLREVIADPFLSRVDGFGGSLVHPTLEETEVASQERLLNMIEAAHVASTETIRLVKAEAQCVGAIFKQYTPMYCFAYLSSG